ncbi:hypothetical protein ACLOJK_037632, partial [Asimina triloba]
PFGIVSPDVVDSEKGKVGKREEEGLSAISMGNDPLAIPIDVKDLPGGTYEKFVEVHVARGEANACKDTLQ